MKYAADFRSIARDALKGKWGMAVVAGILASLLGAVSSGEPEFNFHFNENGADVGFEIAGQQIFDSTAGWNEHLTGFLVGGISAIVIAGLVMAAVFFVLGSVVGLGYNRFNLELVDRQKEPQLGTMFGYFPHWKTAAAARFLQALYVLLWSLLFIIPGIIAGYSYAMTGYILSENPELTASEAIARSKEMMEGNRWRLFCLQWSFIGWDILCIFTAGIGYLWLNPYKQAATAAFYREISGTAYIVPPETETEFL